jgi:sulfonate transport system permease protein
MRNQDILKDQHWANSRNDGPGSEKSEGRNYEAEVLVPFRGGGYAPRAIPLVAPVTFAILILMWWAVTAFGTASPLGLPRPGEVVTALLDMAKSGELARHLGASLHRLIVGFTLGAACGIAVGAAIGLSSFARSSALPVVSALFPVPKIALLPLFILWFGIGETPKIATIALGVFSPIAIATFGGIDGIDRNLIRMAQSFGVPPATVWRKIVFPGALPSLLSGVRIAAAIAVILLTAAEMIGAQHGIGALVLSSGNLMQTDRLIVGVLLLSLTGLAAAHAITVLETNVRRRR